MLAVIGDLYPHHLQLSLVGTQPSSNASVAFVVLYSLENITSTVTRLGAVD